MCAACALIFAYKRQKLVICCTVTYVYSQLMDTPQLLLIVSLLLGCGYAWPWNPAVKATVEVATAKLQHHYDLAHTAQNTGVQNLCTSVVGEQVGVSEDTAVHICSQGKLPISSAIAWLQLVCFVLLIVQRNSNLY